MAWSPQVKGDFLQTNTDKLCDNLYSASIKAADKCQMTKPVYTKTCSTHRKSWFDRECAKMRSPVKSALASYKSSPQLPHLRLEYHNLKDKYRDLLKDKKSNYEFRIRQQFRNVRNATEFWEAVIYARKARTLTPQITLERWS